MDTNQGKRDDQIEFSEMMVGLSILGFFLTIIGYSLYYIISSLLHYVMGQSGGEWGRMV